MAQRPAVNEPATRHVVSVGRDRIGPVGRLALRCQHDNNPVPAVANVFRIGDTLIDTGFRYAIEPLVQALRENPPRRILLTHHHEDHIAGLPAIREAFGAIPILAPRDLVDQIRFAEPVSPYREYFWGSAAPFPDVQPYDAGDVFEEGPVRIEAIATPGHCPHHCGFAVRHGSELVVLSGDLYIRRKPLLIWHEGSAPDAIASCDRLADLADEIMLVPNHLPPDASGSTTLRGQADWIRRESERVLQATESLATRDYMTIATHLYGPPEPFEYITHGEIQKSCFVRSVLDPVTSLPAAPLPPPPRP